MKTEKQQKEHTFRVMQPSKGGGVSIVDNRPATIHQFKMIDSIQKKDTVQLKRNMFSVHNGHTFIVDNRIVENIMQQYGMERGVIQNALDQMAAHQGGNGIRLGLPGYTAELKIQAMGDDRLFSRSNLANQRIWFNIVAPGLH